MIMTKPQNWHLDKKVPITILIVLIGNIFYCVWFAAKADSRLATLEMITRDNSQVIERLVRVETQLQAVKETASRIDASLAKIAERRP